MGSEGSILRPQCEGPFLTTPPPRVRGREGESSLRSQKGCWLDPPGPAQLPRSHPWENPLSSRSMEEGGVPRPSFEQTAGLDPFPRSYSALRLKKGPGNQWPPTVC